jgi:hypothetical protein
VIGLLRFGGTYRRNLQARRVSQPRSLSAYFRLVSKLATFRPRRWRGYVLRMAVTGLYNDSSVLHTECEYSKLDDCLYSFNNPFVFCLYLSCSLCVLAAGSAQNWKYWLIRQYMRLQVIIAMFILVSSGMRSHALWHKLTDVRKERPAYISRAKELRQ